MPRDISIRRVLVIGSGPIVIGQAAEFDYAGTQACRALKEEGAEIILLNSNPATIMTDNAMADHIYIEPLTLTTVKRVIEKERPDSILSGLGGQTGLTLCMKLAKSGFLDEHGVRLLGASPETIDKAEDRLLFKETMRSIGEPCVASEVVTDVEHAVKFAKKIGYPVIVRPAFTLGGTGGGIASDERELREITRGGLMLSPIRQVLVERCISGWKEIEFEVMRDRAGNCVAVCSMENVDPVGIHTGDSIVVAPALTLSDKEYQTLRSAALKIIDALGVEGGCNCQFALDPDSFEYAVIEVNPRVSRSSALASKATGYPIAKAAVKIALGYTLDEIILPVTGQTTAAFEPALDYIALKFPKWPFDKFVYAANTLGTQMKATGEVMSIADSFEQALMKAIRGAEIGLDTLELPKLRKHSSHDILSQLRKATDERLFIVAEALRRGVSVSEIHEITTIDTFFLEKINNIIKIENQLKSLASGGSLDEGLLLAAKRAGYTDRAVERLSAHKVNNRFDVKFRMVDTCAAEFSAKTPYFYATYDSGANESVPARDGRKTVVVLGSGPIRIGQGIEFDYASVRCVWSLREMGYRVVIINNNPETVSTDFDTADRLYFEPLCPEDVMNVLRIEKPVGVIVAFGGQTAIRLVKTLAENRIPILGTSADSIDRAEDRERFDALLEALKIRRPRSETVRNEKEALAAASRLGYPVLMRPSYVLGGQNMIIAHDDADVAEYMEVILRGNPGNIVLIDRYIAGVEIEVDAICDGDDILIPGIMEHIERTGIHSGDSIAVYPSRRVDDMLAERVAEITRKLCLELEVRGLMNLQYIIADGEIYVIEVNPRASRTVPYLSKVTGIPICELATRVSVGEKLRDLGWGVGLAKISPYTAVKAPVFSFEKLTDVDVQLGPEMKSTGEVLGIGKNMEEALYKALVAAGYNMSRAGGVFITVRRSDKPEVAEVAKKFRNMGFKIYATRGTGTAIERFGIPVEYVKKIHKAEEGELNSMTLLESGMVSYIISTSAKGRDPARDSVQIRRKAITLGIPCLTSLDTAGALADSLRSRYGEHNTELVDVNNMRSRKQKLPFTKMQALGNDYIYINCFEQVVNSPESLSVFLSDRRFGVGGDGIILIYPSKIADAKMRIFNLDGSEGKMCGNGIRCVAKYLYDTDLVPRLKMKIETMSGVREVKLTTRGGKAVRAAVDMGKARFKPRNIPVNVNTGNIIKDYPLSIDGETYKITCVNMGNPHAVVFIEGVDGLDLEKIGPLFERHPIFPDRVNTEFVEIVGKNAIKMRVWERGSGETSACGTGACAAAVASVINGHCDKGEDIKVTLAGGDLTVNYTDERVIMTGGAETVYEGVAEI